MASGRLGREVGRFYFQHVDDAGERGQPLLELVVLAAQIGELVAEQVVVDLQDVGDLRTVVLGSDQGVEQILEPCGCRKCRPPWSGRPRCCRCGE